MDSIFGGLIEFPNEEEFDSFVKRMDKSDAISIIESAIDYSYSQNVFSIQETYFIYKSLKKLKENGFNVGDDELQQGEGHSSEKVS